MKDNETILLTHQDVHGRIKMVDVSQKQNTLRKATAFSSIYLGRKLTDAVVSGAIAKGDVWGATRVAAVMAAKRTSDLVPLTHPIRLDSVKIDLFALEDRICCFSTVSAFDRTGVEMEAMCSASVAMLNLYDMVKGVSKAPFIEETRLIKKIGGKSGLWLSEFVEQGQVVQIDINKNETFPKNRHHQVCLLEIETINKMQKQGLSVNTTEKLVTLGICLSELPVGTILFFESGAVLRIIQTDDCAMAKEGVFAVVLSLDTIEVGDEFVVMNL